MYHNFGAFFISSLEKVNAFNFRSYWQLQKKIDSENFLIYSICRHMCVCACVSHEGLNVYTVRYNTSSNCSGEVFNYMNIALVCNNVLPASISWGLVMPVDISGKKPQDPPSDNHWTTGNRGCSSTMLWRCSREDVGSEMESKAPYDHLKVLS